MADKNVASAIALAFDLEREKVLLLYEKLGDMGEVAKQLGDKKHVTGNKLSVDKVFEILTAIAHTGGEGSVEKKQKNVG